MLRRFYQLAGIALLGLYVVAQATGLEFGNPDREKLPPDVRNSPGGYRSFHFWHSGSRGGK